MRSVRPGRSAPKASEPRPAVAPAAPTARRKPLRSMGAGGAAPARAASRRRSGRLGLAGDAENAAEDVRRPLQLLERADRDADVRLLEGREVAGHEHALGPARLAEVLRRTLDADEQEVGLEVRAGEA